MIKLKLLFYIEILQHLRIINDKIFLQFFYL